MNAANNWKEIMESANTADPRENPYGYYSGDSFVLGGASAFMWFKNIDELSQALKFGEPAIYDFADDTEALATYHRKIDPLLERIASEGLTTSVMDAVNAAVEEDFLIQWWGQFDDLTHGSGAFAAELIAEFRDENEDESHDPISADELDAFIEFISMRGA